MIGPKTAISLSAWPGDIFVTAAFSWVVADIMAADLILRAWAVFMLGIVLSEQLPEGSGPISGDTGGYHPGSDDWVSTLGDIADSSKHDSKRQQSFSLEPLETWENPSMQWMFAKAVTSGQALGLCKQAAHINTKARAPHPFLATDDQDVFVTGLNK
ncbi:uncharacterized protein LOC121688870 [Alosa sapidissima]|uniref:uncharacterized protein LOC121688870 n=1 Tax=Alosa sapidissima TaxID=34773 RepID=UPI001C099B40|nr:uncharacterized protein LOC121688870 [Alosa sapidissima]